MEEFIWSNGIRYEQSVSTNKEKQNISTTSNEPTSNEPTSNEPTSNEPTSNELTNNKIVQRDLANEKIGARDMTEQTSQNPFRGYTDYVTDIITQDNFLRPQNSSFLSTS